MKEFKKPNLIPNNKKGIGNKAVYDLLEKAINDGKVKIEDYIVMHKKDGCRMEILPNKLLTRSMKPIKSELVNQRFADLAKITARHNIVIEGEFYSHGMKLNEIVHFFSDTDVTRESVVSKLTKKNEYKGRDVEWLTTFHPSLKFWMFDCYFPEFPDLTFQQRMMKFYHAVSAQESSIINRLCDISDGSKVKTLDQLETAYLRALGDGYEGLVLQHKDHVYKQGRSTHNELHLLKLKEDDLEFDGIVLDVEESTIVKDGVEKTTNELGRSVTSKKKDDRVPSGMAKGFVTEYNGHKLTVSLKGFDNEAKRELLEIKEKYIGRHFRYTAMAATKNTPKGGFFESWRDEK